MDYHRKVNLKKLAEKSLYAMVSGDWELVPEDLLSYLKDEVGGDPISDPVATALALIRIGLSPEKAAALLDWRSFEDLCMRGFQLSGMEVLKGVRFSFNRRRYEIDLLGTLNELILSADCKMWSKGTSPKLYKLRKAAIKQLERTKLLAKALKTTKIEGIEVRKGESLVIPVVITWLDFNGRFSDGVPIIPLYALPNFLDSIWNVIDEIASLKVDYRIEIMKRSH